MMCAWWEMCRSETGGTELGYGASGTELGYGVTVLRLRASGTDLVLARYSASGTGMVAAVLSSGVVLAGSVPKSLILAMATTMK
eukprot:143828-Rhodomonas_salina.1